MMLYLDTSALVKLYLDEPEYLEVYGAIQEATAIATSVLSLPETTAVLSRRFKQKELTQEGYSRGLDTLHQDWAHINRISIDNTLALEASILLKTRELKGADAMQLATAAMLSRKHTAVKLLTYDEQMKRAANRLVKLWE